MIFLQQRASQPASQAALKTIKNKIKNLLSLDFSSLVDSTTGS
jgi:hypothetical protein